MITSSAVAQESGLPSLLQSYSWIMSMQSWIKSFTVRSRQNVVVDTMVLSVLCASCFRAKSCWGSSLLFVMVNWMTNKNASEMSKTTIANPMISSWALFAFLLVAVNSQHSERVGSCDGII